MQHARHRSSIVRQQLGPDLVLQGLTDLGGRIGPDPSCLGALTPLGGYHDSGQPACGKLERVHLPS
jgi:hypothetical protein